ncbi:MAG: glycosyltransferase family 4 protein [Halothiobacillus sp.]
MLETAIVLPHREQFSVGYAGAIALTVAGQLADAPADASLEAWGDPLQAAPLVVSKIFRPLRPAWWWLGRQSHRYLRAIVQSARLHQPHRLEVHNRAHLLLPLIRLGFPVALYLHNDPQLIRGLKTRAERRAIVELADYVVCVSDYVRGRLCVELPEAACSRVFVVPNTVDVVQLTAKSPKNAEIIFVGRMVAEKGVHILVEALGRVLPNFPQWRVRLIGARYFGQKGLHHTYERQLQQQVKSDPVLASQVQFEGYQRHAEVIAAFNSAAIVVVPSLWDEPFGRTALEGMAGGCAVIASNRGGLPEVVGDAGILVEPTVDALARELTSLMSYPDYCAEIGARCAERAHTVFEPSVIHQKINALRRTPSMWIVPG